VHTKYYFGISLLMNSSRATRGEKTNEPRDAAHPSLPPPPLSLSLLLPTVRVVSSFSPRCLFLLVLLSRLRTSVFLPFARFYLLLLLLPPPLPFFHSVSLVSLPVSLSASHSPITIPQSCSPSDPRTPAPAPAPLPRPAPSPPVPPSIFSYP